MPSSMANGIWSQMNYVPPRGPCNQKLGVMTGKCPCLRFMLHPLKSTSSYDCDGCGHHASFHDMENKVEDEVIKRWQREAEEAEVTGGRPRKKPRKQIEAPPTSSQEPDALQIVPEGPLSREVASSLFRTENVSKALAETRSLLADQAQTPLAGARAAISSLLWPESVERAIDEAIRSIPPGGGRRAEKATKRSKKSHPNPPSGSLSCNRRKLRSSNSTAAPSPVYTLSDSDGEGVE